MNLIFNELSFLPLLSDSQFVLEKFFQFAKMWEIAKNKHGYKHVIFPSAVGSLQVTDDKTFFQFATEIPNQGVKNTILSIVKRPFGEEELDDKIDELNKYYYQNVANHIPETYCNGLTIAHVKKELSAGMALHPFWDSHVLHFRKIINDKFETNQVTVLNVSQEKHFGEKQIADFIANATPINLTKSNESPKNKNISLRDDHGKDELKAFSDRLVQSPYIVSIINSLPFNPKAVNLIRRVYSNGQIEMVLYWDDRGIGIVAQTTGTNYKETQAIAEILKKEFDK